MKRSFLQTVFILVPSLLILSCGADTRFEVTLVRQKEDGTTEPIPRVKFQLLPYDIDVVKDSLKTVNDPGPPPDDMDLHAAIAAYEEASTKDDVAYEAYVEAEDEVGKIKSGKTSPAYRRAYNRLQSAKKQKDKTFDEKNRASAALRDAQKAYRVAMEEWEKKAYMGLEEYTRTKLKERGAKTNEPVVFRTNANGEVTTGIVPGGDWWIDGSMPEGYGMLVWNYPVKAEGGIQKITISNKDAKLIKE